MEFCTRLELLVSDPLLFGNGMVTERTPDGVPSISKSISNSNSQSNSYSADFETFWAFWISMGRGENKLGAYDKWNACLKGRNGKKSHAPVTEAELLAAAEHYADKCRAEGTEPRYVMQATTFLGPSQRWVDFIKVKSYVNSDAAYANKIIEEAKKNGVTYK